jgi:hypothetical protein
MKKIKFLPVFFILFAIAFTSCDTEPVDSNLYDYVPVDNGGDDGGDDDGGGGDDGGTSSGDYWPMAVNNQWTYREDGVVSDPMKIISTQTVDGNTYYRVNRSFVNSGTDDLTGDAVMLLRKTNGSYNTRISVTIDAEEGMPGLSVAPYEFTMFKDNLDAGQTWTQTVDQVTSYDMEGIPDVTTTLNFTGTIMEKNISLEVEGHTYTNVIKSKLVMQIETMGISSTITTYYWFAKDVGPIKTENDLGNLGEDYDVTLLSYTLN